MTTATMDTSADTLAGRLFESVLGTLDVWSIYVGEQLGLYDHLHRTGAATVPEMAQAVGADGRYVREWAEQQAASGLIMVDDPGADPDRRRFSLPAGHAEVLCDRDSLNYLAPFVRLIVGSGKQIPALLDAYRNGGGVSWEQFGADVRTGQADMNRPWFINALGSEWFPNVPSLHERLEAGARAADVGCGEGWSTIAMAAAYPASTFEGFDIDGPSIEAARRHAADAGVADRVTFTAGDAADLSLEDAFDVVTAFECIHDLPRPVDVLGTMRRIAKPDGRVVVMDEAVPDEFSGPGDEVERLMYGFSLFLCLPDSMSHADSAATGTVFRPEVLRSYATRAGFSGVEVLPIDNDLWRFYELVH